MCDMMIVSADKQAHTFSTDIAWQSDPEEVSTLESKQCMCYIFGQLL